MRWQCALLQRWLPEYPDGDLPAFWKKRLRSHLEHCPGCRQELAALHEVVAAIKATPVPEPDPQFWTEFSRELHLKLARVAHESKDAPAASRPWWSKLPYLLGAPALAVLALWIITYYTSPERPVPGQPPQVAQTPAPQKAAEPGGARVAEAPKAEKAKSAAVAEAPPPASQAEQFTFATLDANGALPEDDDDLDLSSSDLDSVLAGMTDREKEAFLNKLNQKKRDGSCLERFSSTYLA